MTYTVKELAEILCVNQETIRRWIRFDGLYVSGGYNPKRRHSFEIEHEDLIEFLKSESRYRKYLYFLQGGNKETLTREKILDEIVRSASLLAHHEKKAEYYREQIKKLKSKL